MLQKIKFLLTIYGLSLSFFLPQLTWAKSFEEDIKETGILKIGIRQDSPLFGLGNSYEGYCQDFGQELTKIIGQKWNKKIKLELIKSTTQNRWDLVKNKIAHFECGPNTINLQREKESNIKFSQPFFVTATQVFTKPQVQEEALIKGTIGVIKNTTNEEDIKKVYSPEQINNSFLNRRQGIEAVQQGKIEGFASDGILLMGTTLALQLNPNSYNILTPLKDDRPFCAAYGMILPDGEDNAAWRKTVNELIAKTGKGEVIWDQWFLPFFPYLAKVLQGCQSPVNK
ncbi:MAG TPA: ABC transporter substrate-binding protein [Cyanothece sp. UBA12306]|nr:ABC transporter substrate-binding protein [Cyanothece sp. UBA12306]